MVEFLHMGGYGFYVWCSYGIVVAVLIGNYVWAWMLRKKLLRELVVELAAVELAATKSPQHHPQP